jgi:actin-related protein 2
MSSDNTIIMDSGSGYMKIGYSTDTFPRHSFPALIGRPMLRYGETIGDVELNDIMIGE